jgi:hypothetical protein
VYGGDVWTSGKALGELEQRCEGVASLVAMAREDWRWHEIDTMVKAVTQSSPGVWWRCTTLVMEILPFFGRSQWLRRGLLLEVHE